MADKRKSSIRKIDEAIRETIKKINETKKRFIKRLIQKGARKIKEEDVKKVIERSKKIERKFSSKGPLKELIEIGYCFLSLVKDYWYGRYRKIPYFTISAIVFSLLYVLNPLDLIPDFIPLVGHIDDASVTAICYSLVKQDLYAYKEWKAKEAI